MAFFLEKWKLFIQLCFKKFLLSSRTRLIPVTVIVIFTVKNRAAPVQRPFLLAAWASFTCRQSLVLLGRFSFKISCLGTPLLYLWPKKHKSYDTRMKNDKTFGFHKVDVICEGPFLWLYFVFLHLKKIIAYFSYGFAHILA